MTYSKLTAGFLVAGMLLLSGCGSSTVDDAISSATGTQPSPETPAQDEAPAQVETPVSSPVLDSTTVTTVGGKTIKVNKTANGLVFEGYEGKIVLLEMYGWNCPHCIAAIPGYNRLKNKYPNDVYIITVESYGTNPDMQKYVADYGIQYDTVAKQNAGKLPAFVQSLTGYTVEAAGVPSLLVFTRSGDLAEYLPPQDLPEAYVDSLIQGLL